MYIALVHKHYDESHLEEVKQLMLSLGTPDIHAVWMDCYNHWVALEGCHRLRAAHSLGLIPNIIEVEYSDNMRYTVLGDTGEEDYTISELCDNSYCSTVLYLRMIIMKPFNNQIIKNNPTWGGIRPGAGRPSTGRKKRTLYITDAEYKIIKEFLKNLRPGN